MIGCSQRSWRSEDKRERKRREEGKAGNKKAGGVLSMTAGTPYVWEYLIVVLRSEVPSPTGCTPSWAKAKASENQWALLVRACGQSGG